VWRAQQVSKFTGANSQPASPSQMAPAQPASTAGGGGGAGRRRPCSSPPPAAAVQQPAGRRRRRRARRTPRRRRPPSGWPTRPLATYDHMYRGCGRAGGHGRGRGASAASAENSGTQGSPPSALTAVVQVAGDELPYAQLVEALALADQLATALPNTLSVLPLACTMPFTPTNMLSSGLVKDELVAELHKACGALSVFKLLQSLKQILKRLLLLSLSAAAAAASAPEILPLTALHSIYPGCDGSAAVRGACYCICSGCLLVFYDKRFPARRLQPEFTDLSRLLLWTLVVANMSACEHPSFCAFLCAVVQVPPVRAMFQVGSGRWPRLLAQFMPAPGIAASMRQLMGPPYVMFVASASMRHWCSDDLAELCACAMSIVAATAAICAGCLVRPDNDWTGLCWFGRANSPTRRAAHGRLMIISFVCNVYGALLEGLTVSSERPNECVR
jgi:hypothetical protein